MTTRLCAVEACDRGAAIRGLCIAHYKRQQRLGDPGTAPVREDYRTRTEAERFWEYVDKTGECWLWTGAQAGGQRNGAKYGSFRRSQPDGRQVYAHRWAWEQDHGPIPPTMTIDHLAKVCSSTLCVRADHMELVTRSENARRAALARRPSR